MSRSFLVALPAALAVSLAFATVRSDATAPAPDNRLAPATSEADRGCCVWKSTPVKCAFTNRGYCRTKAGQSGIEFDFYEGTNCSAVSACPRSSPGSLYLSPDFLKER